MFQTDVIEQVVQKDLQYSDGEAENFNKTCLCQTCQQHQIFHTITATILRFFKKRALWSIPTVDKIR